MKVQRNFFRVQHTDPVLLHERIDELAAFGLGLELRDFMLPELLDSKRDLEAWIGAYQTISEKRISLSIHGPAMDLNLGSLDERIRQVSIIRIVQTLRATEELDADFLIVHTGYDPRFLTDNNRFKSWLSKSLESYKSIFSKGVFAKHFKAICVENSPGEPLDRYSVYVQTLREKFLDIPIYACLDYNHFPVGQDGLMEELIIQCFQDPMVIYLHLGLNERGRAIYQNLPTGHYLQSVCFEGKVGENLKQ